MITVVVYTQDLPAAVTMTDRHSRTVITETETVAPNSDRTFHVVDIRSLQIAELPADAT